MTPGHPWRRRWRETVVPILWLLAAAVTIGSAAGIKSAHAAPTSPGEQYAHDHAPDICIALDAHPTIPGVLGVLTSVEAHGLSAHESGVAVATSVINICPIHVKLLRQFVNHYRKGRAA